MVEIVLEICSGVFIGSHWRVKTITLITSLRATTWAIFPDTPKLFTMVVRFFGHSLHWSRFRGRIWWWCCAWCLCVLIVVGTVVFFDWLRCVGWCLCDFRTSRCGSAEIVGSKDLDVSNLVIRTDLSIGSWLKPRLFRNPGFEGAGCAVRGSVNFFVICKDASRDKNLLKSSWAQDI